MSPPHMTAVPDIPATLSASLPPVRGTYTPAAPLAPLTTFGIGGPAEVLFTPADIQDMADFWRRRPAGVPVTLLGEGSNVLVRDGGIPGITVRIGPGCDNVKIQGHILYCEAGAGTGKVARAARNAELAGAAFLCGIPGSMGGALVMNAGCYGEELCDRLTAVDVIDDKGVLQRMAPEFFKFAYRSSTLPENWIFAGAEMALTASTKQDIRTCMRHINHKRGSSQPLKWPNAGSLFKNPPDNKAWELIQQAGCRGLRRGDAQVSEKHSNFFINRGHATAADMEDLAEEVRTRVFEKTGVTLVWEVRLLGDRVQSF